ncbi:unnamed protein product [Arctia plantaginis]|uniref:Uncharacterized protein n=1 Tax=Arctia plantaginis TaxID=874455 RepID=A0A8S1BKK1_ARCPL|nr:unnamed protein product [Arctia plantaginis]
MAIAWSAVIRRHFSVSAPSAPRAAALRLSAASAAPLSGICTSDAPRDSVLVTSVYVRPFAAEDELPRRAHYSAYYAVKTIANRVTVINNFVWPLTLSKPLNREKFVKSPARGPVIALISVEKF